MVTGSCRQVRMAGLQFPVAAAARRLAPPATRRQAGDDAPAAYVRRAGVLSGAWPALAARRTIGGGAARKIEGMSAGTGPAGGPGMNIIAIDPATKQPLDVGDELLRAAYRPMRNRLRKQARAWIGRRRGMELREHLQAIEAAMAGPRLRGWEFGDRCERERLKEVFLLAVELAVFVRDHVRQPDVLMATDLFLGQFEAMVSDEDRAWAMHRVGGVSAEQAAAAIAAESDDCSLCRELALGRTLRAAEIAREDEAVAAAMPA
jgi:hypothetical protein